MEKTAVEFLIEQLDNNLDINHSWRTRQYIEQAKEMFEQQIEDAWKDGFFEKSDSSKIYYHKTFKIE
jgi:flagellar biosynthesis/type III secretory pathway protein FliH